MVTRWLPQLQASHFHNSMSKAGRIERVKTSLTYFCTKEGNPSQKSLRSLPMGTSSQVPLARIESQAYTVTTKEEGKTSIEHFQCLP